MAKTFWIHVTLFSFFLILMVASRRKGGDSSRADGSKSEGNQNPNPGGSNNHDPKSKTNSQFVADIERFVLGNAVSNMRYRFDNEMDSRYYNRYQNQMPSQVYLPMYQEDTCVTKDRFVTDCYNMSVTEYVIKANVGKNISEIDQTEVKVKSSVIRQLCDEEYKRGPSYYNDSGLNLLFSPSLILFITLFVYFMVE